MQRVSKLNKRALVLALLLTLSLLLVACGDDDKDESPTPTTESTPTVEAADPTAETTEPTPVAGLNLDGGVGNLDTGSGLDPVSNLPGCSDPDAEDCPVPLDVPLDGEAVAGDVTLPYVARYFDATTTPDAAEGEALIEIVPSERNKFEFKGTFTVYFAESIDAALAELVEPEITEWSTDTLTGKVGVSRDESGDEVLTTSIGAFETADGRVIVLKAVTTGKFGWDFHVILYEKMLAGLTVAG